jgi:hypothetical protein
VRIWHSSRSTRRPARALTRSEETAAPNADYARGVHGRTVILDGRYVRLLERASGMTALASVVVAEITQTLITVPFCLSVKNRFRNA